MLKIIVTVMVMAVLTLADGPVLQTGQTLSYDANGNIVTDGSLKDDGYYQAGVVRSYSRSGDIVIDNATGIQWQDDAGFFKPWVTQQNFDAGNFDDTSGNTAATYCSELGLGTHTDWRLPSIEELETLVDNGNLHPAFTKGVFQNSFWGNYWSSTTLVSNTAVAWSMYFDVGFSHHQKDKNNTGYIRCVRGEQLETSNLSRSGEIVSDNASGLQWQDDSAVRGGQNSWAEAISYCEKLTLGDYRDWRLPNKKELLSIVDYSLHDPALDTTVFLNISPYDFRYPSSTTYASSTDDVWFVNFSTGRMDTYPKGWGTNFRCVRGGQIPPMICPEGKQKKQGERICITGTPVPDPEPYPDNPCGASERLVQGSDTCTPATEVGPPGLFLPTCPEGERLIQGTELCIGPYEYQP